jgi:hypothetical protein
VWQNKEIGWAGDAAARRHPGPALSLLLLSVTGKIMKRETVRTVTARIALLEIQEQRLMLLIQFPPPGCRNVALWRQIESNTLCSLRQSLRAQRELLASITGQLKLDLIDTSVTVRQDH